MGANAKPVSTNPELLNELKKHARTRLSSGDLLEQQVSYIYGSVSSSSGITREQIRRKLVEESGA